MRKSQIQETQNSKTSNPLLQKLNELKDNEAISMHVPGHKNNTIGNLDFIDIVHDKTEIQGLDNLHEPEAVIKELNDLVSKKYEGYIAQVLTNGSTTGIIASILAYKGNVNRYIVLKDVHKSVHHGIDLAGHRPTFVRTLDEVKLESNDVVIMTYPSYEGRAIDIESTIKRVHREGASIIIDEAHGAHFDITPMFPRSTMNFNADVVIQSYHKMLPALTMGSVVFTNKTKKVLQRDIMKYINYIESSSPSYLVMASIEYAHGFYLNYSDEIFSVRRQEVIQALTDVGCAVSEQDDPAKLLITHENYTPYELEESFVSNHIYPEMTTEAGVLFVLPLAHAGDRYPYDLLKSRLSSIQFESTDKTARNQLTVLMNKVCIQHIIPYPPGIPLVLKGEIITEEVVKRLIHLTENRVKIEGVTSNIEYYIDRER